MGTGIYGSFGRTYGSLAFGSTDYMKPDDKFSIYIQKRTDIDANGFYDVIAHGNAFSIEIQNNGKAITINHRDLAKLLKQDKKYGKQGIRLLSCSTGQLDKGFAQNLANKLGVPVKAPTDILWVNHLGHYHVTGGYEKSGKLYEDKTKPGKFKTFYPERRKK